jgi:hypothetical protein
MYSSTGSCDGKKGREEEEVRGSWAARLEAPMTMEYIPTSTMTMDNEDNGVAYIGCAPQYYPRPLHL